MHVLYSGSVQGVGFRFTAVNIATILKIKGWVRNLPDSRVEIIAEGEESSLKNFFLRIDGYFNKYISSRDIEWLDAAGNLGDFEVKL